jgi:hypothetical protein
MPDENISQKKRIRRKKETSPNIQIVIEESVSCDGTTPVDSMGSLTEDSPYENTFSIDTPMPAPESPSISSVISEFVTMYNDEPETSPESQPSSSVVPTVVAPVSDNNVNSKKRGRKSKGGKLIHKSAVNDTSSSINTNIILHLKCSMKDIQEYDEYDYIQDPLKYNPTIPPEIMMYNENDTQFSSYNDDSSSSQIRSIQQSAAGISPPISSVWKSDHRFAYKENICSKCYGSLTATSKSTAATIVEDHVIPALKPIDSTTVVTVKDSSTEDDEPIDIKDVNAKLKQLRIQLYKNEMHEKKSACFWCTYEFDNPPCYILKYEMDGTICGYGSFCRPECGVGFLMKENIDDSTKFERYQLMNQIYGKVYGYKKNIKPAPNPYYLLDKYYGNLSIQQYRKLLKTEHMLLVIDKPLTRILPELHDDNDEFILNIYGGGDAKLSQGGQTGGGVYKVKRQSEKKQGPTKNSIIRDKFGLH